MRPEKKTHRKEEGEGKGTQSEEQPRGGLGWFGESWGAQEANIRTRGSILILQGPRGGCWKSLSTHCRGLGYRQGQDFERKDSPWDVYSR